MNLIITIFMLMTVIAVLIAVLIGKPIISGLRRLHASQTEREELASHKKKEGTPTMGGFIFIIAIVGVFFAFFPFTREGLPVILLALGFGAIGFIDDFLKVVLKRSDGLIAWQKFLLQFVLCTVFIVYLYVFSGIDMTFKVPFLGGYSWDIGFLGIPLLYLAIIGTVNGVNFTDGLDGLASNVTVVVCIFFTVACVLLGSNLVGVPLIVAGGLLGFLVYNTYPAKTFMGDTGSLFLGGFVAGMAVMLRIPIFIIIVGFIYLLEVVSVILQVLYFKKTHGKRIFRMAPIHHHFELGGWSESRVVYIFSLVTVLLSILGILGL